MITFIVGLLIIGGSAGFVVCTIGMMLAGSTPGRRTRGFARWWARCTRWAHRLGTEPHKATQRGCEIVPVTYMQATPRDALAAWSDRPTLEEFAAAPPFDHGTVDRLLAEMGEPLRFSRGGVLK